MDQNARTTANLSAATSRFAPAGGAPTASRLQSGVNQSIAQQSRGNVQQGMEYMRQKAMYDQASVGQYLDTLAKMYSADLGAGQGMYGQQLSALQAQGNQQNAWLQGAGSALSNALGLNAQEKNAWLQGAGAAKGRDVASANDWQKQWWQYNQQLEQQAAAREKQNSLDNMLRRVTTGYNYNTGWNANPDVPGTLAYLQALGVMPTGKIGKSAVTGGVTPSGAYMGKRMGDYLYNGMLGGFDGISGLS